MTNSRDSIVALVVTYNRKELLQECLKCLNDQTVKPAKILLIDNASTDGTGDLFKSGNYPSAIEIDYRRMSSNLGGAGGFHAGLEAASSEECGAVWLMDDDCMPAPDALEKLLDSAAITDGRFSFMASSVYGPEDEPMNVPTISSRAAENGYSDWYRYLDRGIVEIEAATFVSLLINSEAIRKVGLPIASFFIWGDDTEYTKRLTKYYAPAYFVGASKVLHKRFNAKPLDIINEENLNRLKNYRYYTRNNLIVLRYYGRKRDLCMHIASNIRRGIKLRFGRGSSKLRRMRCSALLGGTFDYLLGRYDLEDLGRLIL